MAEYELWLTDDGGRRLASLTGDLETFFFSYTRTNSGLGTLSFGCSFQELNRRLRPYFRPDWRMEVWRSAAYGQPLRREDVYLLRKPNIYSRKEDGLQVINFYGRNGIDLLMRRCVIQRKGTSWAQKTDQVDDLMKAIVREQMLYGSALDADGVVNNTRAWPQNEFSVQANVGLGPAVTREFADRNVYDILKDLKAASQQLNIDSATNRKIYFDVVPKSLQGLTTADNAPLGWEFQTFADLRGADRSGELEFSLENENLDSPDYSLSHLEEVNSVILRGNGQGLSQIVTSVEDAQRTKSSRWNRCEKVTSASSETSTTALQDAGRTELYRGKPREVLEVALLNSPGGPTTPRSLYGLDWDMGDKVRVSFAGKQFDMEINVVYVAVDDQGRESISGRSLINE